MGFLGGTGGVAKKLCKKEITVQSNSIARIQECHIFLAHFLLEKIEDNLLLSNKFKIYKKK